MPEELMRLVYTSIHGGMSEQELQKLTPEVRSLSNVYGISGLLVVCDEDFFVILEGSPIEVTTILANTVTDQRHHSVNILLATIANQRIFESWKVLELKDLARSEKPLAIEVKTAEFNPRVVRKEQLESTIAALAEAAHELPI